VARATIAQLAHEAADWVPNISRRRTSCLQPTRKVLEDTFQKRLAGIEGGPASGDAAEAIALQSDQPKLLQNQAFDTPGRPSNEGYPAPWRDGQTTRLHDKEHCKFVARGPCIVCGRTPAEAHHVRFARPRAHGRKVSDEYTVPVCRIHHRELHQYGR
jgi:hypothetical protein